MQGTGGRRHPSQRQPALSAPHPRHAGSKHRPLQPASLATVRSAPPLPLFASEPPAQLHQEAGRHTWADADDGAGSQRLKLPRVSGYDACCRACTADYACKRFQGAERGCTLYMRNGTGTGPVKGPRKSYVAVMQPV